MNLTRTFTEATPLLLQGLRITVLISVLAILFGTLIGFFSCLIGLSKLRGLREISAVYIWIIRGTPMIVQAFIVYFGFPQLIQMFNPAFRISAFTAGLVTLSLNAGAYISEIFRGGISAVDKGQIEAARSLGLSRSITMVRVTLPQAIKIAIPSMVNQFIITIKDTSILSVIGLADIVNKAKVYVGASYQFFTTYILVAVYYLVIISVLMLVSQRVEKRFNYERKKL
ncbi:MAG: amino acid ABC transporter permease [Clostridiales bacterium]|jgi:His/Glu/Gln/Arg/opine family amino acid ABC transporter permease subunit|nr:amino acid ABC transporter permease [Clostridiales bacterium]